MMRTKSNGSLLAGLLLLTVMVITLSGCKSGLAIVTATPPPTLPVTVARLTLPPTWTPVPLRTDTPIPIVTATKDAYILTLTAFLPQSGPTINPTTPAPPTAEGTGQPPLSPLRVTYPAACANFVADTVLSTRTMSLGSDATIVWKPIKEANLYHLWLVTADGFYRFNTTVTGDRAIIPAKQFLARGEYGWELVAYIDANPLCNHLTGVIVVR